MGAPLLHYIAVNEIKKSYDPLSGLSAAAVEFSKSDPFDQLMQLAKAVHIFGGGGEPKKPATLSSAGPTPNSAAKIVSPSGASARKLSRTKPASLVSAAGHTPNPAAKITSPEHALVSPTGAQVSSKPAFKEPSGQRGSVDISPKKPAPSVTPASGTPSSVRSPTEQRTATIQRKMGEFRQKQAQVQAAKPKPQATAAAPPSETPAPATTSAEPPGEGASPAGSPNVKPTQGKPKVEPDKPYGGVNIMGAHALGSALAPGGAGSGITAARAVEGRVVMGAHRLLNARAPSHVRREQYGRETALQMSPSQRGTPTPPQPRGGQ